ncbi:MAG: hypothetical protein KVP17_002292 [Porospora cf. gigantea B]|uniref:uncharacterized protein n=1 Tax=Porospora cf. gigantea B TaxID=2853592 RepID=UPI00357199B6|nr:MAG: hypothetical protein KVP17_002292 [Porospora cf. gigantea B]
MGNFHPAARKKVASCLSTVPSLQEAAEGCVRLTEYMDESFEQKYVRQEPLEVTAECSVYRCINRTSKCLFTMKVAFADTPPRTRALQSEITLLKYLGTLSPFIVNLWDYSSRNFDVESMEAGKQGTCAAKIQEVVFVMDNFDSDLLRLARSKSLTEGDLKSIARQLLRGLQYVHNHDVVHQFVRPAAVKVVESASVNKLKLGCFHRATRGVEPFLQPENALDANFFAPELLHGGPLTSKADIWAAGLTLFFCLHRYLPFSGDCVFTTYANIMQLDARKLPQFLWASPDSLYLTPGVKHFLESLLHPDPLKRLTAEAALNHRWIRVVEPVPPKVDMKILQSNKEDIPPSSKTGSSRPPQVPRLDLSQLEENVDTLC